MTAKWMSLGSILIIASGCLGGAQGESAPKGESSVTKPQSSQIPGNQGKGISGGNGSELPGNRDTKKPANVRLHVSSLPLPRPGTDNNPINVDAFVAAWLSEAKMLYGESSIYKARGSSSPPNVSEIERCVNECPRHYSTLTCHYFCWHPSSRDVGFDWPNIRGCLTKPNSDVYQGFFPKIFDYCMYQEDYFEWVPGEFYLRPNEPLIRARKMANTRSDRVGVLGYMNAQQEDAFKFVMYNWYNPFAFRQDDEQAVLDQFYQKHPEVNLSHKVDRADKLRHEKFDQFVTLMASYDDSAPDISEWKLNHPSQISAGHDHTCALENGRVVCWGKDIRERGWLKNFEFPPQENIQVSAGRDGTCVLYSEGLRCLKNGESYIRELPPYKNPIQVSYGDSQRSCALERGGRAFCWEFSNYHDSRQTGYGTGMIQVSTSGSGVGCVVMAAGKDSTYNINCNFGGGWSVLSPNRVGDYPYNYQTYAPLLNNVLQVSAGYGFACVLTEDRVYCWGNSNQFGELTVPPLRKPMQVSAGLNHACALDQDGVHCWGDNSHGQSTVPPLRNPFQVSAGGHHTCALDLDGPHCWGDNSYGQSKIP